MHPIIALWCHPRSMSTATERIMRERGDLQCFHEPFLYDYYLHRRRGDFPHFQPEPGRPTDYESIRDGLLEAARHAPVFFKDMSYYVLPRIYTDRPFAARLTNTFLIRNPKAALASYHAKDPAFTNLEAGIEAQWRHYCWLAGSGLDKTPPVLRSEAVQHDPEATITAFWQRIGLAPKPEAFTWSPESLPRDWQEVAGWHGAVTESTAIRAPEPEEKIRRRFESAVAERPVLEHYRRWHQPAYDAFKAIADQQGP